MWRSSRSSRRVLRRRFVKADLRWVRAVLVRVERRDWAEESRARCWNWKGVLVEVDAVLIEGVFVNVKGSKVLLLRLF